MARAEITVANFIDQTTSPENSAGIVIGSITWSTLTAGSNNGKFFSFFDTEGFYLTNDTGGAAVFTIPLTEPDDYAERGITFDDKTFTLANGATVWVTVDSRFKDADNYVNIDCDVAGKIAIVKRYQIK